MDTIYGFTLHEENPKRKEREYASKLADGLILCRRTKTSQEVGTEYSCRYAKKRNEVENG